MFGRLSQDLDTTTENDNCDDRTNDKIGVATTQRQNEGAGHDNANIGNDIIFGKYQRRSHVDSAISMFCNEREANGISNQRDDTNSHH